MGSWGGCYSTVHCPLFNGQIVPWEWNGGMEGDYDDDDDDDDDDEMK